MLHRLLLKIQSLEGEPLYKTKTGEGPEGALWCKTEVDACELLDLQAVQINDGMEPSGLV